MVKKIGLLLLSVFILSGCTSKQDIARAEFESVLKDTGFYHGPSTHAYNVNGELKTIQTYSAYIFDKTQQEITAVKALIPLDNGTVAKPLIKEHFTSKYSVRGDKNRGFRVSFYRNVGTMHIDYALTVSNEGVIEDYDFINKPFDK